MGDLTGRPASRPGAPGRTVPQPGPAPAWAPFSSEPTWTHERPPACAGPGLRGGAARTVGVSAARQAPPHYSPLHPCSGLSQGLGVEALRSVTPSPGVVSWMLCARGEGRADLRGLRVMPPPAPAAQPPQGKRLRGLGPALLQPHDGRDTDVWHREVHPVPTVLRVQPQ